MSGFQRHLAIMTFKTMKEEYAVSLRIITKRKKKFTKVHTSSFASNNLAEVQRFAAIEVEVDLQELDDSKEDMVKCDCKSEVCSNTNHLGFNLGDYIDASADEGD